MLPHPNSRTAGSTNFVRDTNFVPSSYTAKVDLAAVEKYIPQVHAKLAKYSPNDIFNFDETSLFYCIKPTTTIGNTKLFGTKQNKSRITLALCTNASGSEKVPLLFIGKNKKNPRCLGKKTPVQHGFTYYNNEKAWMTNSIFSDWLLNSTTNENKIKI